MITMPHLCMYIGKILVERVEMDYEGLWCTADKEHYQQKVAQELIAKHRAKVNKMFPPLFYIEGVESKINKEDFYYED